jgi:DNA replication protein DnaC
MAAGSSPLQSHPKRSMTGYDEYLDKVRKLFPITANWPDETIIENIRLFKEASEHISGYCCNIRPLDPRHTYKAPTERPGEFETVQCPKAWQTAVKEAIAEANLPKRFLRLKLADLDDGEVKTKLLAYVNDFEALKREGKGLLLAGSVGTGKTQRIVSLAVELINRYLTQVKFITCHELLELYKRSMKDGILRMKLKMLCECELMIVDDVGANRFSEYDQAAFGSFINDRYNEMLPVVLSTNLSKADLKELVGERVTSRITEMCERIVLTGPDRREGK